MLGTMLDFGAREEGTLKEEKEMSYEILEVRAINFDQGSEWIILKLTSKEHLLMSA